MSTNQFRRYLDLLNEADLVPPNTNVALPSSGTFSNDQALAAALAQQNSEPRCAFCGTPQSQHQALQHQFVAGGEADRPAPVAQGGGGDVDRVKQLQAELKAAGANLGATGPNRDGVDGDIGPLTTAAMTKYPNISAKYADLSGAPISQAATPAVNTSKLTSALNAIETVIAKYKGKAKVSESQVYEVKRKTNRTPPSFTQDEIDRMTARPSAPAAAPAAPAAPTATSQPAAQRTMPRLSGANLTPAQQAAQRAGIGIPRLATAPPTTSSWASRAGKAILSKLPGLGARTAARAGATALSGPLAPFVGPVSTLYTIWDVGNMLYDAYKDSNNLKGMNDADQAVIEQNLAVVNSFMKDPKIADTLPQDIKTRVEKVFLDLDQLAKETGYAVPGQQPVSTAPQQAAPQQAAPQQAATPPVNAAVPDVTGTLDKLDKLLKKNNFESREPKTLSEQMARDRDIVDEGLGRIASKAARRAANDIYKGIGNNIIGPAARLTTQLGTVGGLTFGAYEGYEWWKELKAPKALSAADQAEFTRLLADYNKMVPDLATFNALPPDVQKKLIDIANRLKQAEQQPQGN
jgi:hypothetical protein